MPCVTGGRCAAQIIRIFTTWFAWILTPSLFTKKFDALHYKLFNNTERKYKREHFMFKNSPRVLINLGLSVVFFPNTDKSKQGFR